MNENIHEKVSETLDKRDKIIRYLTLNGYLINENSKTIFPNHTRDDIKEIFNIECAVFLVKEWGFYMHP